MTHVQALRGGLAVITGGASGIGEALAKHAALKLNMHVAVVDVSAERAESVTQAIIAAGGNASSHGVDVTDAQSVANLAEQLEKRHGAASFVACNAGIEYSGHLWEMSAEDWRKVQAVNVDGAFNVARAFLPRMIIGGGPGHLLFTSSIGGIGIAASQGAYTVSKHAVRVLAQSFAADLEDIESDIGVSILLPAAVQTRIFAEASTSGTEQAEQYRQQLETHLREEGKTPEEVADITFAGVEAGRRWIYSHPDRAEVFVNAHSAELLSGLA